MNKKQTIIIVVALCFIVLLTTVLIFYLYDTVEAKKDEVRVELIKILVQGVLIGVLGLWVKFLLDEASKKRDREKSKIEQNASLEKTRKDNLLAIFMEIRKICNFVIKNISVGQWPTVKAVFSFFEEKGQSYEDLLDNWQLYESEGDYKKAREAYEKLYNDLNSDGDQLTVEKRQQINNKFNEWKKYYEQRIQSLVMGNNIIIQEIEW